MLLLCLFVCAVFCCAARNRLVCRQRNRPILPLITSGKLGKKALKEAREAIKTLIASTKPPSEQVCNRGQCFSFFFCRGDKFGHVRLPAMSSAALVSLLHPPQVLLGSKGLVWSFKAGYWRRMISASEGWWEQAPSANEEWWLLSRHSLRPRVP